jgi:hypothetical protein
MSDGRSQKSVLFAGVAGVVVGGIGLLVGMKIFPDSNLLGGLAIIFGPIYWLGWLFIFFWAVGWYVRVRRERSKRLADPDRDG